MITNNWNRTVLALAATSICLFSALATSQEHRDTHITVRALPLPDAPSVRIGDGGTPQRIDNIEVWTTGWPDKLYRVTSLIIVTLNLPTDGSGRNILDPLLTKNIASLLVAPTRSAGGDMAIWIQTHHLDSNALEEVYQVANYITDQVDPTTIVHEKTRTTANGKPLANGAEIVELPPGPSRLLSVTPIKLLNLPDPIRYSGPNNTGTVIVKLCVDVDGHLATPVEIIDSSNVSLNDAAQRFVNDLKLRPATIDGKPASTCKPIKITFGLHR
jgi:hypothetical protein